MKLALLALTVLIVGCATASHHERASLLAEPVNCEAAEADIAALEAAMPSRGERAKSVVQTVTPVGAVTGVVTGTYKDRAAVLTGRTQGELTARIEDIEATCGLSKTAGDAEDK
jgi:hypothetical protein